MFVLDTNVISALMLAELPGPVAAWLRVAGPEPPYTTAICQAEIMLGIALLPQGRRRAELARRARLLFEEQFELRVLEFTSASAAVVLEAASLRKAAKLPVSIPDLLIAALAREHGATLVTRNTRDFEHCGVPLVNPWQHA